MRHHLYQERNVGEAGNCHDSFAVKVVHASRNFGFLLRGVLPLRLSNYNKFVGCFYMLGDGSSIDKEPNGEGRGLLETSRVAWAGLEYRRSLASHTVPTSCPSSTSNVRGVAYETERA